MSRALAGALQLVRDVAAWVLDPDDSAGQERALQESAPSMAQFFAAVDRMGRDMERMVRDSSPVYRNELRRRQERPEDV